MRGFFVPRPGDDRPVDGNSELTILTAIRECKREAEQARRTRLLKNKANLDAYLGQQDWSHKQPGQSTEFLPKTPVAVEQWSAFMKRALIQFGQWKSADVASDYPLKAQDVLDLLDTYLDRIPSGLHKTTTFPLILSDAVKIGLLEALIILKIYGRKIAQREFFTEQGVQYVQQQVGDGEQTTPVVRSKLKRREKQTWRLCIDLIKPEDYFPDPTGRSLYEIHQVERDIHDVEDLAEQGIYDQKVVELIQQDFARAQEEWDKARSRNQEVAGPPSFRKRVLIHEFWGDVLTPNGRIAERNIVCAMANDQYLLRPPEANPLWHGESPFVAAPLIRVPDSVWHKAIYDHGSPLNLALNELFNLMLDGGISSVWGIKQLRTDWLEDPRQVASGVPQGITLAVKQEMPPDMKVLESVVTGEIPSDAMAMFQVVDRQFDGAVYTNDLKLGLYPPKKVLATEVVEASQSQAVTLDGISADLEYSLIAPTLRKAWLTILQNADDLSSKEVIHAIGLRATLMLSRMAPAERFAALAQGCSFKVHGLTATLSRVRDFQKTAAYLQIVSGNPILLQRFFQSRSVEKVLNFIEKTLNINPESIALTDDEKAQLPQLMEQLPFFQQMTGGPGKGGATGSFAGNPEPQLPAEIQQAANPVTGMSVGGQG